MSQNNLSIDLKQLDDFSAILNKSSFTVSDTSPSVGEFRSGILADTNQTTISLPFTTIRQVLIKNTHATATIVVVWTPNGGAEVTINKLGAGAMIALWDSNAIATGKGITSLKLTASVADTTYLLFLGG